jgi:hypothetical protein
MIKNDILRTTIVVIGGDLKWFVGEIDPNFAVIKL